MAHVAIAVIGALVASTVAGACTSFGADNASPPPAEGGAGGSGPFDLHVRGPRAAPVREDLRLPERLQPWLVPGKCTLCPGESLTNAVRVTQAWLEVCHSPKPE